MKPSENISKIIIKVSFFIVQNLENYFIKNDFNKGDNSFSN